MVVAFEVFRWVSFAAGSLGLIAASLWALGYALVRLMEILKVWKILLLAVAVRAHGKDYSDRLFWQAVREKAERSQFSAESIANYALKHSPGQMEQEDA